MNPNASSKSALITGAAPMRGCLQSTWQANLSFTLPFLILYWVDLAHHTLFFDETNAWAIAAASPTLGRLFQLVHYEGHPWLWYFLLWLPSRFTHAPRAMIWVVAPVGTAIYLSIGMLSPFTRAQKALVFLGYFVAFEYTVMNRMYCVMFLMALLFVWRRMQSPDKVLGNVMLLGVMANTDMSGLILSSVLLLEYLYDRVKTNKNERIYPIRKLALPVGMYGVMALLSVASLLPAPDISWHASGRLGADAGSLKHLVRVATNMIAAPWWPISPEFPRRFWETDAHAQKLLLLLVPFVLVAYWRAFKHNTNLLLLMGLTLIFGILFAHVVYVGRVRHWGISFIAFLLCLWMNNEKREREGVRQAASWPTAAYALMTLSAVAGIVAIASSWTHPFSQARNAANWIRQNEPQNVVLVGAADVSFATVAEEMQRPVYFMECYCTDTFKLFSNQRDVFPEEEVGIRLSNTMERLKVTSLVFVFSRPLLPQDLSALEAQSLSASLLKEFPGADAALESHYIYRIERRNSANAGKA